MAKTLKRSKTITTEVVPVGSKKTKTQKFKLFRGLGGAAFKSGFPPQLRMTHRYTQRKGVSGAANFQELWSTNGLFAPAVGGGGHQPLYYDQLTAIYNHYTVVASRIKAWFICLDQTGNIAWYPSVAIDDDSVPSGNMGTTQEEGRTVNSGLALTQGRVVLRKSWKPKASFGGDPLGDPNLQGTVSANPTEQEFFVVQAILQGTAVNGLSVQIEIEYDTVWQELKTITGS